MRHEVGVTGEAGGQLLVCYLYHLEQDSGADGFLADEEGGAQAWLDKTKPKLLLGRQAAKLCVEHALKFLPKLKAGLAAHKAAATEDDDMDDLFDD